MILCVSGYELELIFILHFLFQKNNKKH